MRDARAGAWVPELSALRSCVGKADCDNGVFVAPTGLASAAACLAHLTSEDASARAGARSIASAADANARPSRVIFLRKNNTNPLSACSC